MTKAKPMVGPGWHKRMRVHRHNGYLGCAKMMQMQLRNIMNSDSTTGTAKDIAMRMWNDAELLATALKTRIDP